MTVSFALAYANLSLPYEGNKHFALHLLTP